MTTLLRTMIVRATIIFTLIIAFTDDTRSGFLNKSEQPSSFSRSRKDIPASLQKTSGKALKSISSKPLSEAARKAQQIRLAAEKRVSQASNNLPFKGIQNQIHFLNEKMDMLEEG